MTTRAILSLLLIFAVRTPRTSAIQRPVRASTYDATCGKLRIETFRHGIDPVPVLFRAVKVRGVGFAMEGAARLDDRHPESPLSQPFPRARGKGVGLGLRDVLLLPLRKGERGWEIGVGGAATIIYRSHLSR